MMNTRFLAVFLLMLSLTIIHADEPAVDPFPLPDDVEIVVPSKIDPQLMEQIGRALDGQSIDSKGDEILRGMLESIRRRGSVLDGSVLDDPSADNPSITDEPSETDEQAIQLDARRVRTAHSLLRSAQLLDSLNDKKSGKEQDLVIQLRRHAVKLLLQTLPPEPSDRTVPEQLEAQPQP